MTRLGARRGLFISIAITAAVFVLREPLAQVAADANQSDIVIDFFYDRWALALCLMFVTYFAYRISGLKSE